MLIAIVIMTSTGTKNFRSNRFIVAHLVAGKRIKILCAGYAVSQPRPPNEGALLQASDQWQ
jgi:hypothetical protein